MNFFTSHLLKWHRRENTRIMPWKGETDPYKIWLSEIILQQTRVEQGWAYYERFLKAFPTVRHLARAPEKQVFKLWEGLGYYIRCRNLIATARIIASTYKGRFPQSYDEIRNLKGVGPYTAAAIASFAFGLPYAVVDGNVERVLSRYFGISTPLDTTAGKKLYTQLADSLLDKKKPGLFNQAIMDLGAVVCKPRNPLCMACPLHQDCEAYTKGWLERLPVKEKKPARKKRWFYYYLLETPDGKIYIRRRTGKDIWQNLYELVLLETSKAMRPTELLRSPFTRQLSGGHALTVRHISKVYRQDLTHQTIEGRFIHIPQGHRAPPSKDYEPVDHRTLQDYAFPAFINVWLRAEGNGPRFAASSVGKVAGKAAGKVAGQPKKPVGGPKKPKKGARKY